MVTLLGRGVPSVGRHEEIMRPTTPSALTTSLNQVVRNHLTVASQLFLHDLIAMQWREDAIHDRYSAEYLPDISRLFRLFEHLLDAGYSITPGDPDTPYAEELATAGKTVPEMLDIDHTLLADIQAVMQDGAAACDKAGDAVAAGLLNEAVQTRSRLIDWIETQRHTEASGRCLVSPAPGAPERALWERVNLLLTRMLAIIDQTVCHTFALKHNQEEEAANTKWRMSWQSMRDTASIVRLMAARGWAMDTRGAAYASAVSKPVIAEDAANIAAVDSALHRTAVSDAEQCVSLARDLGDVELEHASLEIQGNQHTCADGTVPDAACSYPGLSQMTERWAYPPTR